jgi:hypothetical protein
MTKPSKKCAGTPPKKQTEKNAYLFSPPRGSQGALRQAVTKQVNLAQIGQREVIDRKPS